MTFHPSLVMPSTLRQSRAEVMLHMAHSLFSAQNISFEILERGKVIFNKLESRKGGGYRFCLCKQGGCPIRRRRCRRHQHSLGLDCTDAKSPFHCFSSFCYVISSLLASAILQKLESTLASDLSLSPLLHSEIKCICWQGERLVGYTHTHTHTRWNTNK